MNALDALTAHRVVSELGCLVAREELSPGTRFPRIEHARPAREDGLLASIKRHWREARLARELAKLSDHQLRDIGMDPSNLSRSVSLLAEQHAAEERGAHRRARLLA